jgi:hypothetical protein
MIVILPLNGGTEMQRQLRDIIQNKYGVSSKTSGQVIQALTEIEKHRQGLPGRSGTTQDGQAPNIENIVGGLFGSGSAQKGGMLGLIITIIMKLFGMGKSGQPQSGNNVSSILSELMGGATHPGQAPDLASILVGLMGTGSGGQASDIEGMVTSLLSGQASSQGGLKRPFRKSK